MNATERIVIKEITKSLKESLRTDWNASSSLEDWSVWARKMKETIKTSVPILEKLADEEVNKDIT